MTVSEPAQQCAWPLGPHDEVVISMGDGEGPWCLLHGDEMLADLTTGILGGCVICGKSCLTWNGDACVHPQHRRELLLRQVPRNALGAYQRGWGAS